MTSYTDLRDQAYLSQLEIGIGNFQAQYQPGQPTIFFFPGGFGSELLRASHRFDMAYTFSQRAWLDCGVVSGDASYLRVESNRDDVGQRFIVPDGEVDFDAIIFRERPYAGFVDWCARNDINLFMFGWDWRLGVEHSANFFLDQFLPMFEAILGELSPPPLDNFFLVGHSAGGMVLKAILNQTYNDFVRRMTRAITVGTPFYGYGEQAHCFIRGQNTLNTVTAGGGPEGGKAVIRLACSMPGSYEFLHLDQATYDANRSGFESDLDGFDLFAYPSIDRDDGTAADPFNIADIQAGNRYRYPMIYGFDLALLSAAAAVSGRVAMALEGDVPSKLFNIRGVQLDNSNQVLNKTPNTLLWERVASDFDPWPTRPLGRPIKVINGPGDGVQAAWGARLLGLPRHQVITIRGHESEIEHTSLMNATKVQNVIGELLGLHTIRSRRPRNFVVASREGLNEFLYNFEIEVNDGRRSDEERRARIQRYLSRYSPAYLQQLFRRAYMDFLKP